MSNTTEFQLRGIDPCHGKRSGQRRPAWAEGIRTLYDAVTQEPLPPEFQVLLTQLGKANGK